MKRTKLFSLALLAAAWLAGGSAHAWDEPAQDANGVWQLGSVNDVEWYSDYVDAGNLTAKAVLTADIDYTGQTHTAIGRSDSKKYQGVFDGQGHRIKNLHMTGGDVGFFNQVRGEGTVIKNLIIDASCSFEGTGKCAALIAQPRNGKELTIYNVVNMASVQSGNGAAGGLVGNRTTPNITALNMSNCVNAGTVNSTGNSAGAFVGWVDTKVTAKACYNIGEVQKLDGNKTNLIRNATLSNNTITNCYDLINTTGTQGIKSDWITADPVHSGELCYVLNHGDMSTDGIPFTQDLSDPNSIPLPISGKTVYQVADLYCDGTPKGSVSYSNTEGGSTQDDHVFDSATGLCTRCSYPKEDWLSADADGFYYLGTPEEVEWFSHMVRDAHHNAMNVKLTADIDFGGVADAHLPIGTNTQKYFGHFDGQGHRIKGMVLTTANDLKERANDGQGFFGSVRGGGVADGNTIDEVIIENLIIDASCSVTHDQNFAAGVVGRVQAVNSGSSVVIIRNCGNEANVTTSGKNAAGILGCVASTNVGLKLYNLWNKGTIVGNGGESAAICAWTGQRNINGEVDVEGCWNIGEVTGIDGNGYNLIRRNTNIVPRNIVDLCITNSGNQGKVAVWNTADPISSGELCYLLNGDQTTIVYTQTLGTDAMPVYRDDTHSQVYQAGTVNCLGASVGSLNYNNVSGETVQLGHNINDEIGMCDVCHAPETFQAPALVDGYYEIKNAGNLEWFSNKVDEGGDANLQINGKLMNDIDLLNIVNLHKPIGVNTGKKYNGTFDGQGFRIKNMIIERPNDSNIGFFGFLRGNSANTTVKNLIMDASCTIHGYNRVGGITGSCQNNGTLITLENIINEATVIAEHQDAAGIIGGQEGNGPKWLIKNVLNLGTVTAKNEHPYAGALCCYLGGNSESVIENFVNLGTINGHEGGNIGRIAGTYTNIIDLSDTNPEGSTASGNIGFDTGLTKSDVKGGKLAYTVGWWQELGVDDYPTPFEKAGAVVYRTGEERCDGADIATTVYSNTDGGIVTNPHAYSGTTGLCDDCGRPNADFKSLVDGAYVLDNVNDVQWFAAMVNYGSPAINGNLTADLDFEGGSCRIGNDANSYRGTFKGNDHVVSNFVINNSENIQGFFGWVTGGADISGITFDNTCSIKCNARGGIVGAAKDGGTVKLTRLGNEGTVTTANENAAGIIGTDLNSACVLLIDQCYSTGTIKGGRESAQIAGWTGANSVISNSWSCAEVEGVQSGREFSRYGGDNHDAQYVNCFTTYHETNGGLTYDTPLADFESGKVAYATGFGQNIGTDATPSFSAPEVFSVGDAGYATMFDTTTGYELKGDVKAYVATTLNTWLNLTEIENVPAETPVILKGTYFNKLAANLPAINASNELKGAAVDTDADGTMYILAKEGDTVGFYKAAVGSTIPAGKAYYQSGSGVKAFFFEGEDDATAIQTMDSAQQTTDGAIYNVAGQRVSKMQKGINIVGGKKVLR